MSRQRYAVKKLGVHTEYTGEININDQRHGFGELVFVSGPSIGVHFKGQFQHDRINGYGANTRPNGEIFEGMLENNKAEGHSIVTFPDGDGDQWEGPCVNNKQHGAGIYTIASSGAQSVTEYDQHVFVKNTKGLLLDAFPVIVIIVA